MEHLSYEESKKHVYRGFWILLVVTLMEVGVSLFGKLYLVPHFGESGALMGKILFFAVALLLIAFSLYKARYIVFEFMHMKFEAKGLAMSVLFPLMLLIWAIIAFFQEGNAWREHRENIEKKNEIKIESPVRQQGLLQNHEDAATRQID
jgi:cytochrome c oxidase subunit 4